MLGRAGCSISLNVIVDGEIKVVVLLGITVSVDRFD